MENFDEYYYIGRPGDEIILDYYFYKFVCYIGDQKDWFEASRENIPDETVLMEGRWRDSPRRVLNQEVDVLSDYYIIHKDDNLEKVLKYYPDIDREIVKYILQAINEHKTKENISLDYLIEFMWHKLNLREKCEVTK